MEVQPEISHILKESKMILKDDQYGQLFGCKLCGKSFTREHTLKMHLFVHFKIKRFACDICCKRFTLKQHLREHAVTHTKEKPYKCSFPGCNDRFRQRAKLSVHKKMHQVKVEGLTPGGPEDHGNSPRIFRIHIQTQHNLLEWLALSSDFPSFFETKMLPFPKDFQ